MAIRKLDLTIVVLALASFAHGIRSQSDPSTPLKLLASEKFYQADQSDLDPKACCIPAIFSFGSSVADTGTEVLVQVDSRSSNYPFGITYPGYASGRWSDGRLLIDLWADVFDLPYLDPFIKSGTTSFRQGAKFACGSGSATDR
ncbi:hypothetical protein R1flu_009990 [Riccia fluitans]|uniref:Uncharacterized protein n=1 Tax=Riccia fluitans TaxID=41844 RepID=A0ABD1Z3Q2_9MARC